MNYIISNDELKQIVAEIAVKQPKKTWLKMPIQS